MNRRYRLREPARLHHISPADSPLTGPICSTRAIGMPVGHVREVRTVTLAAAHSAFKSTVKPRSNDLYATLAAPSKPYDLHVWSGWRDSNPRPPAPKAGALTKLRHIPSNRT